VFCEESIDLFNFEARQSDIEILKVVTQSPDNSSYICPGSRRFLSGLGSVR